MLRAIALNFAVFMIVAANISIAFAGKRIALVVGNDDYENIVDLKKAVNDAQVMAETLRGLGFDILRAENVGRRALNRKIHEFTSRLEAGDEALFYFAGHGVEISGQNFLLPTDTPEARLGQEGFLKSEAISVDQILDSIRGRGTRISLIILDACRNNPFPKEGTRSLGGTRGIARMAAPEGTFIMYSAGVGQMALDELGGGDPHPNSVFTRTLVPLLKMPGLSLTDTARRVRREVRRLALKVSHEQRPAYYDEVIGEFYFTQGTRTPSEPQKVNHDAAATAWDVTKDTDSAGILKAYIKKFPDSVYASFARARLKELAEKQVASVSAKPSPAETKPPRKSPEPNKTGHPFDGRWKFTQVCFKKSKTYYFNIRNGRFKTRNGPGTVSRSGKIKFKGRRKKYFNGALKGNTGSGAFAPGCGGKFARVAG